MPHNWEKNGKNEKSVLLCWMGHWSNEGPPGKPCQFSINLEDNIVGRDDIGLLMELYAEKKAFAST